MPDDDRKEERTSASPTAPGLTAALWLVASLLALAELIAFFARVLKH